MQFHTLQRMSPFSAGHWGKGLDRGEDGHSLCRKSGWLRKCLSGNKDHCQEGVEPLQTQENLGIHNPKTSNSLSYCFAPASLHSPMIPPQPRGPRNCMAHGHEDPHTMDSSSEHKLTSPDAGLDCANVKQKLWVMALILVLLKMNGSFSLVGGREGGGTLETQGFNSMQINVTHSLGQISENSFSCDIARSPPH